MIPVSNAALSGNEREYVDECMRSGWISSKGRFVGEFEKSFAEFCGVEHALGVSNGTVALHLALLALGVGPGDEVIVPSMTYVASANAVRYVGATVVLVDCLEDTYCIDPAAVERALTEKTRAIIVVHLFGQICDMAKISRVAKSAGVFVVEDAAEAHGATSGGARAGSLADVATFSFYGNKIISCGEGGALTTNDEGIARRVRLLMGQGQSEGRRFWHEVVGYNYRMTNVAAAILVAQLEQIGSFLASRQTIRERYEALLSNCGMPVRMQHESADTTSANWLVAIVVEGYVRKKMEHVEATLAKKGIETRLFFHPMHALPIHRSEDDFPVSDRLANEGICLPTWVGLTEDDQQVVVQELSDALIEHAE